MQIFLVRFPECFMLYMLNVIPCRQYYKEVKVELSEEYSYVF